MVVSLKSKNVDNMQILNEKLLSTNPFVANTLMNIAIVFVKVLYYKLGIVFYIIHRQ